MERSGLSDLPLPGHPGLSNEMRTLQTEEAWGHLWHWEAHVQVLSVLVILIKSLSGSVPQFLNLYPGVLAQTSSRGFSAQVKMDHGTLY